VTKFTTLVAIIQNNEARRLAQTLCGLSREPAAPAVTAAKTPRRLRRLFDGSILVQPAERRHLRLFPHPLRRVAVQRMLQAQLPRPPATKPALVPAVTRAAALLDLLAQQREAMSLARLSASLGLPKSSVHGLCNTLSALGYLRREDDGCFFIGPRVMGLAHAFVAHTSPAQEFTALWAEAGAAPSETVILSVLDGADVVYVAARNGVRPLGLAFTVGMRLPAHRAATGKAMLAWLDEARLRSHFPQNRLPAFMNRAPIQRSDLVDELAEIRRRGYSIDDESVREGVYCFGAPVFDASGQAVAGVGVCLQKAMLDPQVAAQQSDTVMRVARELTQRLGGSTLAPAA
jgi:DNA-binding IclR family transcriptional regulator